MTTVVCRDQLGALEVIGEGAPARVYRTAFRLPNDQRPLTFKELLPPAALQARGFDRSQLVDAMDTAITTRDRLATHDREEFDETAAWPLGLVRDGGRIIGLLMPLNPGDYFIATNQNGNPRRWELIGRPLPIPWTAWWS